MTNLPSHPRSGSNLQAVDTKALERLRQLGGNELVLKMIDLFSSHAQSIVTQALAAFNAGDLEGVERAAHSIKSSAGNVGAVEVRQLAERIEEAAHMGDTSILQGLVTGLEHAFRRATARLDEERSSQAQ